MVPELLQRAGRLETRCCNKLLWHRCRFRNSSSLDARSRHCHIRRRQRHYSLGFQVELDLDFQSTLKNFHGNLEAGPDEITHILYTAESTTVTDKSGPYILLDQIPRYPCRYSRDRDRWKDSCLHHHSRRSLRPSDRMERCLLQHFRRESSTSVSFARQQTESEE